MRADTIARFLCLLARADRLFSACCSAGRQVSDPNPISSNVWVPIAAENGAKNTVTFILFHTSGVEGEII